MLRAENLTKDYPLGGGVFGGGSAYLRAVDNVSFEITEGRTFGLVGESGCGKSTLSRMVIALETPTKGKLEVNGTNPFALSTRDLKAWRRDVQIVAQDPSGALPARMRVARIVEEAWRVHRINPEGGRQACAQKLLRDVGIGENLHRSYPHQLSGGQRQRVMIARALALQPKLIVCDEPVSALDVSVQAQVLELLRVLQSEHGLTYFFISHDLSVVRAIAETVGVMFAGTMVEQGPTAALYQKPLHPYTHELIEAMPTLHNQHRHRSNRKGPLLGADQADLPRDVIGCPYRLRCPMALERCKAERPLLRLIEPDRWSACHRAEEISTAMPGNVHSDAGQTISEELRS